MKFKYFIPLISFLIPTIIMTIFMIPGELSIIIEFSICLLFFCVIYFLGIRGVIRDVEKGKSKR
jgi:amino acid transporter